MKQFFYDGEKLSMGRLLSFTLFFVCTGTWIIIKLTKGEVTVNDMSLIQWGWVASIGGKAVQKIGERK